MKCFLFATSQDIINLRQRRKIYQSGSFTKKAVRKNNLKIPGEIQKPNLEIKASVSEKEGRCPNLTFQGNL